nr:hypothetical protein BaRGS_011915 [Batillaria attramentaria]
MKWQNVALKDRGNEPQPLVKLNINLSPRFEKGFGRVDSMQSFGGYESDQENESPAGKRSAQVTKAPAGGRWESDDEFESVSQVTGPRRPVWQVPDSDAESSAPYGGHKRRSKHRQEKRGLASTVPTPFQQSALRAGDLDPTQNLTWSPGLRPEEESSPEREDVTDPITDRSGGWVVPDDSDAASLHDWNQRVKGKRRDPRAY